MDQQGADAPSWRVLVVEDEYYIADELRRELALAKAEIVGPVPSVARALELVAEGPRVSGAVLDVQLGHDMVWPVARSLRKDDVPFVFATGYADKVIPEEFRDAPLFRKPVNMPDLIRTLHTWRDSTREVA